MVVEVKVVNHVILREVRPLVKKLLSDLLHDIRSSPQQREIAGWVVKPIKEHLGHLPLLLHSLLLLRQLGFLLLFDAPTINIITVIVVISSRASLTVFLRYEIENRLRAVYCRKKSCLKQQNKDDDDDDGLWDKGHTSIRGSVSVWVLAVGVSKLTTTSTPMLHLLHWQCYIYSLSTLMLHCFISTLCTVLPSTTYSNATLLYLYLYRAVPHSNAVQVALHCSVL